MALARGLGTEEKETNSQEYEVFEAEMAPVNPETEKRLMEQSRRLRTAIKESQESFNNCKQRFGNPLPGEPGWERYCKMICG
ncbi:MAG: hypothetical protein AB1711_11075 [Thermodesulfobacteriota bacterium]